MSNTPRTHYPDAIFGRPCCWYVVDAPTSRDLKQVTCKKCRAIVEKCERAEAQRQAERSVAHG